ncbi:MAG: hypothetical protein AAF078_00660 [Planctomycetota bacterium]
MWGSLGGGRAVVAAVGLAGAMGLGGCYYEERIVRDSWPSLRELADPKPTQAVQGRGTGQRGSEAAPAAVYSIRLAEFVGIARDTQARRLMQALESATGLEGAWVRDTGRMLTAYYGRYTDPAGEGALRDLETVRNSGLEQANLAVLVPLAPGQEAVTDPLDARAHRRMMSLQVAAYDADFGEGFRDAAESAARHLREDGAEAFFYHGPHRSMVLVGLFTREVDFVTSKGSLGESVEGYGPRIKALQAQFPYNLLNGYPQFKVDGDGNRLSEEPIGSFIVRIF